MPCLNNCRQGRRRCPTPLQCNKFSPFITGTLVTFLLLVIAFVLIMLSLR